MGQSYQALPLFPLHMVLFPYAQAQIHIFEERYLRLVNECQAEDRPFGVVLIRDGSETGQADPYLVGTAVRILRVQQIDEHRLDIQVQGEGRFRIRELDYGQPYLVGQVEPVVESAIDNPDEADSVVLRAKEDFRMLVERLLKRHEFGVKVVFPSDPVELSFTIANLLPIADIEKQRLLEITDTVERLGELIPVLEGQILDTSENVYRKLSAAEFREWNCPN